MLLGVKREILFLSQIFKAFKNVFVFISMPLNGYFSQSPESIAGKWIIWVGLKSSTIFSYFWKSRQSKNSN